jgi:hypothetical protein
MERGVAMITIDFAGRIAHALRVDLSELFVEAGPWIEPRAGRPPAVIVTPKRKPRR